VSTWSPEEAYRALQKLARADGRTTQQIFELYVHERFLARLASSRFAERLVLKGGMLLAVPAKSRWSRSVRTPSMSRGGVDQVSLLGSLSRSKTRTKSGSDERLPLF
jgi:hypothetical protein